MKSLILILVGLGFVVTNARADEASQCVDNAGTFIAGAVTRGPAFKHGHLLRNVELSHTHVTIKSDQDGASYDVAMDNVFAIGYDSAGASVPSPLNTLTVGTRIEVCGKPYPQGGGIDWVHTDCGDAPTSRSPNGWVKVVDRSGFVGPNLEESQEYCSIFRRRG